MSAAPLAAQAGARRGSRTYRAVRSVLGPIVRCAYRLECEGLGRIPPEGPVVLAANHRSFMDSIFLSAIVPRPISFMAKAEYFDRRRTAWVFRVTEQIPVRRGSPAGARQAYQAALEVLAAGGIVGIYPEGTRSRDGILHRGGLGAARAAAGAGAPIIPVGLAGTEAVQAPGESLPHLGKVVTLRFGDPLPPPTTTHGRAELRELTEEMMHEIARLCGQDYGGKPPAE